MKKNSLLLILGLLLFCPISGSEKLGLGVETEKFLNALTRYKNLVCSFLDAKGYHVVSLPFEQIKWTDAAIKNEYENILSIKEQVIKALESKGKDYFTGTIPNKYKLEKIDGKEVRVPITFGDQYQAVMNKLNNIAYKHIEQLSQILLNISARFATVPYDPDRSTVDNWDESLKSSVASDFRFKKGYDGPEKLYEAFLGLTAAAGQQKSIRELRDYIKTKKITNTDLLEKLDKTFRDEFAKENYDAFLKGKPALKNLLITDKKFADTLSAYQNQTVYIKDAITTILRAFAGRGIGAIKKVEKAGE